MNEQTGLIRSLVGIRGVLSAVVVAVHLSPIAIRLAPEATPVWTAVWHHSYLALDLFFVLSGFVVTSGYRKKFATWPGGAVYGRFLWARLSRFYPVHLAVLGALVAAVLVGAALGLTVPHGGDLGIDLLRQLTLTQGWGGAHALTWNGPTWSLSAEWFCYLLLPLIIPVVLRFRTPSAVVAGYLVATTVPLVAYGFLGYGDPQITYVAPLWRAMGGFLGGALLCQLTHVGSRIPERVGRLTGAVAALALAALVGAAVAGITLLAVLPIAGLVVLGLSQQRGWLDAALSGPRAMRAGDLSVTLFLTHVPWLLAASVVITPQRFPGAWGWLGVGLLIGGALVVSWVTFVQVERPAQQLMRRMTARPATTTTAVAS